MQTEDFERNDQTYYGSVLSLQDALLILEGIRRKILPPVKRRLNADERRQIEAGSIYAWNETETGMKRWTDGKVWSASKVKGPFLVYREHDLQRKLKSDGLIKQSFSLMTKQNTKLHLIAYYDLNDRVNGIIRGKIPSQDPLLFNCSLDPAIYSSNFLNQSVNEVAILPPQNNIYAMPQPICSSITHSQYNGKSPPIPPFSVSPNSTDSCIKQNWFIGPINYQQPAVISSGYSPPNLAQQSNSINIYPRDTSEHDSCIHAHQPSSMTSAPYSFQQPISSSFNLKFPDNRPSLDHIPDTILSERQISTQKLTQFKNPFSLRQQHHFDRVQQNSISRIVQPEEHKENIITRPSTVHQGDSFMNQSRSLANPRTMLRTPPSLTKVSSQLTPPNSSYSLKRPLSPLSLISPTSPSTQTHTLPPLCKITKRSNSFTSRPTNISS